MSFLQEYMDKPPEFYQNELKKLISEYNKERDTYLFLYNVATDKSNLGIQLDQQDYYVIHDMLVDKKIQKLDFYIETLGGSPETVEDIVKFLRSHFEEIYFVIAGEAKSAGTMLVLSGDDIFMTETGSLGPIDIQMQIGRSWVSVYSYREWIKQKRKEARNGKLNQFDAYMIAQISPGEIRKVNDWLNLTGVLVGDWLPKYKFKDWKTPKDRKDAADKIVKLMVKHSKWKTHGRSLKIQDLENIGLHIKNLDADFPTLAEIVHRIHTACMLYFSNTNRYKIYATADQIIYKQDVTALQPTQPTEDFAQLQVPCEKCNTVHNMYARLNLSPTIEADLKSKGFVSLNTTDETLKCSCGGQLDLQKIRNQIKQQTNRGICR